MKAAVLILTLLFVSEARAHCYSHWHYPWPQRCHNGQLSRPVRHWGVYARVAARMPSEIKPDPSLFAEPRPITTLPYLDPYPLLPSDIDKLRDAIIKANQKQQH